jgi:hypothetical protein
VAATLFQKIRCIFLFVYSSFIFFLIHLYSLSPSYFFFTCLLPKCLLHFFNKKDFLKSQVYHSSNFTIDLFFLVVLLFLKLQFQTSQFIFIFFVLCLLFLKPKFCFFLINLVYSKL